MKKSMVCGLWSMVFLAAACLFPLSAPAQGFVRVDSNNVIQFPTSGVLIVGADFAASNALATTGQVAAVSNWVVGELSTEGVRAYPILSTNTAAAYSITNVPLPGHILTFSSGQGLVWASPTGLTAIATNTPWGNITGDITDQPDLISLILTSTAPISVLYTPPIGLWGLDTNNTLCPLPLALAPAAGLWAVSNAVLIPSTNPAYDAWWITDGTNISPRDL